MKLRSMMCVGAVATAMAAFATDALTDSKTLGWMRVDSTNAVTVVGVPWAAVTNTAVDVSVANLIKTDNLTAGDSLYVYNDGAWSRFVLNAGRTAWEGSSTTMSIGGKSTTIPAATDGQLIARGKALYLERQNPTEGGVAKPFYLYGAVGATAVTSSEFSGANKYLVASPKASAFVVNHTNITGASNKDTIQVPLAGGGSRIYQYFTKQNKWRCNGKWEDAEGYEAIALGTGFWYLASSTSAITFNW